MSYTNNPSEFSSNLISGLGPYYDPNSIYSAGHRTYLVDSKNNITDQKDISGIVENIEMLGKESPFSNFTLPQKFIKEFKGTLQETITINNELNGLAVDLKFNDKTIITTSNTFINL
jgi:hypothetical protein